MLRILACFLLMGVMTVEASVRADEYDKRMATEFTVVSNGVKWIDGRALPLEGKAFKDVAKFYDRVTSSLTTNVNKGVHWYSHFTAGMQFRFSTDSKKLRLRWHPFCHLLESGNLARLGQSGIDVYRFDEKSGRWRYLKTGCPKDMQNGGAFEVDWKPGEACIVNLPSYNGLKDFFLGVDESAEVKPLPPRKSGVTKPVVFYGTSITQGGCASRPGMGFVNIIGRDLDVPVVNLGFSGSGNMELEMADHLAKIDASCYVIDTLWNTSGRNHEKFIRILRGKRPGVPIVVTDKYDALGRAPNDRARLARTAYDKLVAEGFTRLHWLAWDKVYDPDGEDTVDTVHASDKGMANIARALGPVIKSALDEVSAKPPLKVLAIGNSFSDSLLDEWPQVAKSLNCPLDFCSMYIGGCTLERHMVNLTGVANGKFKPIEYWRIRYRNGEKIEDRYSPLKDVLTSESWDVITLQQGSPESWRAETYYPYGDDLVAAIRKLQPKAEIVVQETWSYTPFDLRLKKWGITNREMYEKLHAAYYGFAKKHGLRVIPMGTAVEEWRRRLPVDFAANPYTDVCGGRWLSGDVYHLNERGEYFQALVWTAALFKADVTKCAYRTKNLSPKLAKLMQEIAAMGFRAETRHGDSVQVTF